MKVYFFIVIGILLGITGTAVAEPRVECRKLDHKICVDSEHCIIDHADRKKDLYEYICRDRRPTCETNLPKEEELRSAECEKRKGCSMLGICYCSCNDRLHSDYNTCLCECGGGIPRDCRAIKN